MNTNEDAGVAARVLVPAEPTEAQWGGLARDIMFWLRTPQPTPAKLFKHLELLARDIPQWLRDEPEMQCLDHVVSKGTCCVLVYRAMLADAPAATGQPPAPDLSGMSPIDQLEAFVTWERQQQPAKRHIAQWALERIQQLQHELEKLQAEPVAPPVAWPHDATDRVHQQERMFWVAADPTQPGAAFAACADDPRYAAENEEAKADWIERGATPQLVDANTMRKMLTAWKRPGQQADQAAGEKEGGAA